MINSINHNYDNMTTTSNPFNLVFKPHAREGINALETTAQNNNNADVCLFCFFCF